MRRRTTHGVANERRGDGGVVGVVVVVEVKVGWVVGIGWDVRREALGCDVWQASGCCVCTSLSFCTAVDVQEERRS